MLDPKLAKPLKACSWNNAAAMDEFHMGVHTHGKWIISKAEFIPYTKHSLKVSIVLWPDT